MGAGPHMSITVYPRQAVAEITKMQTVFGGAVGSMNAAAALSAAALKGLGVSMLALGASAMVTYGAVSSFNQSLTHVRALGDLTQKDMNNLALSINNVSVAYGVSGDVIADGTVVLAKAGLTVDQINDSIGAMTALSKANAISFEEAANMTVVAVESFKLGYGDVTDTLDKMQVAAQQSILDIGDLQKAFAYAGSTAMMTGVSYEELLAIMAVLSNRALEAGISARSTNKMLLDIVQHAPELEKFYQNMGKNFDIIEDGQLNVSQLIAALGDATINVEFLQGATDIFTVRALRAFGLLAGASGEYAEMLGEINNASGELERTVGTQLESFSARLEILKLRMVALLRSPEVIAGIDMMVTGFEKLAHDLIPEFTRALAQATTHFAALLANEALMALFKDLVNILLNFLSVGSKFIELLTGWNSRLIKAAVVIKLINILSGAFIGTMMSLNQTFREQLNLLNIYNLQQLNAINSQMSWTQSVMHNMKALKENNLALSEYKMNLAGFLFMSEAATVSNELEALSTKQSAAARENLSLAIDHNNLSLSHFDLQKAKGKAPTDLWILQTNLAATSFQMLASAMMSAVTMGMMYSTMDFSPTLKWIIRITAAINILTTSIAIISAITNATKAGLISATPTQAVVASVAAGAAMAGVMMAVARATKGEFSVESANIGADLAALESQYAAEYTAGGGTIAAADTGMFARRTYDEGGIIGPRHQMVYVEPGEQIISKTQGMVGMGGGITVNVGDVYAQDGTDFAEKLASALPMALRNVSYRGAF